MTEVFEKLIIEISETPNGGLLQLKWDQPIAEIDVRRERDGYSKINTSEPRS
ncbi:MAG: hypothetical protein HKN87_10350 [Saprospiraceae bacterium]|nr:hypothetical protein [Saprospiraceae bacterium]